jgi:hypothetical protein
MEKIEQIKILNRLIRNLQLWHDSKIIISLMDKFKSYSGYKYLMLRKWDSIGPTRSDKATRVRVEGYEVNPIVNKDAKTLKRIPVSYIHIKEGEGAEIPNILINRKGMFVLDIFDMLPVLENSEKSVKELIDLYFICSNCQTEVTHREEYAICQNCEGPLCPECADKINKKEIECATCKEVSSG